MSYVDVDVVDVCMMYNISSSDSKRAIWNSLVPKKKFAADFMAEKSQEGLRRSRKTNDRRCPIKLGPGILKMHCCFWSLQKTSSPSFRARK